MENAKTEITHRIKARYPGMPPADIESCLFTALGSRRFEQARGAVDDWLIDGFIRDYARHTQTEYESALVETQTASAEAKDTELASVPVSLRPRIRQRIRWSYAAYARDDYARAEALADEIHTLLQSHANRTAEGIIDRWRQPG
jgi:hypothetical protein